MESKWVDRGWWVAVEFQADKGVYAEEAIAISQRHPGFQKLVDPARNVVYRNIYRSSEMLFFWELWSYLNACAGVRVFVCGDEIPLDEVSFYAQKLQPPAGR